ncbi:hypothetical protein M3Y99_00096500 [Aphelenchoides fujianensis]|nr:hypothetical protein M3Y99_00096500 [Aphelenchoides fujianensis]
MPITRRQARDKEDEWRRVKAESLRLERAKRRREGPPPVVTIDSDGEREEAEHAGAKRPRRAEEVAASSSGLQLQPQTSVPIAEVPPLPVKQEVDVLPRRKKKRVDRAAAALAAATIRMAEMERRLETLEQANAVLRRQNDEQAAEIARLKRGIVEPEGPLEMSDESFVPLLVPPNDQASLRKPKLKDDARRALLHHAFRISKPKRKQLAHKAFPPPNHIRYRSTRLQTGRFFVCCRAFSAVFFRPSERFAKSVEQELQVGLSDAYCCLWPASGTFRFYLSSKRLSRQSLFSFLRLGQAEVRRLVLEIVTTGWSSGDDEQDWKALLPALQHLRNLDKLDVEIDVGFCGERRFAKLIEALRESLPDPITSFTSRRFEDFHLIAPQIRRIPVGKARISCIVDESTFSFGHLFRSNARVLDVGENAEGILDHGPCAPNPVVERVLLQADIGGTTVLWKNKKALKFRSLFSNLRSLNDNFVIQILLNGPLYIGSTASPLSSSFSR